MKIHPLALISVLFSGLTLVVSAEDAIEAPLEAGPFPVQDRPTHMNQLNQIKQDWLQDHPNFVSPQIVNGSPVDPFSYPYMVKAGGCGASLVGPYTLLCAAHCAGAFGSVQIGRHNLNDSSEVFETHVVAELVSHPDYSASGTNNDFMMVRLQTRSEYAPVVLSSEVIGDDVELTVMGWGTTSSGGNASPILLEVDVDSMTNQECKGAYGQSAITDAMICAARTTNGVSSDSCQGDSGGPIIKTSTGEQVGVVSWGAGCANPNYPGVYARVSDKLAWINEYIAEWADGPAPTPVPPPCDDTPNWIDSFGDGCAWYGEVSNRCAQYGADYDGGMGVANDNCCVCGGGTSTPVVPPAPTPTPPAPTPPAPTPTPPAPTPSGGGGGSVQDALDLLNESVAILEAMLN